MATKTQRAAERTTAPATAYEWREGARFGIDANEAGQALEQIGQESGGAITPEAVVDAARHPDHPLHRAFTWDDTEAAEAWRKAEARQLINSIRVTVTGKDEPPKVSYLSVTVRDQGRAYLPASVVMSDAEYRAQALADAFTALEGWQRRYRNLQELADVNAAIDRAKASRK